MRVLFTGGTGRSGTTITARLVGAHSAFAMIPIETKFITASGGLCDLARGRTTYPEFERRLRNRWFDRGPRKGLHVITDMAAIESALPSLREGVVDSPWQAAAAFSHALLDPIASAAGATGWIEMNPPNAFRARQLDRMFPGMQLIHSIRDGRDVACSITPRDWGPTDLDEALDWWAGRLERGFAAGDGLGGRVHVVQLEDLLLRDREGEYSRLRAFLGLADEPGMRMRFENDVTPAKAHIGRWRDDVPPDRLATFEGHHDRLAATLRDRGRPYVPVAADELAPVG